MSKTDLLWDYRNKLFDCKIFKPYTPQYCHRHNSASTNIQILLDPSKVKFEQLNYVPQCANSVYINFEVRHILLEDNN